MAEKALPPISDIRQRLKCDPATGELWRWTGSRWIPSFTASDNYGYKVGLYQQRQFKAHRVIWALHYGVWPESEIDHINGVRSDNRIENLRLATRSGQLQNVGIRASNTSGYPGVSWHRGRGRWRAAIRCQGAARHIGYFDSAEEAGAAYLEAKARLHTFSPRLRA